MYPQSQKTIINFQGYNNIMTSFLFVFFIFVGPAITVARRVIIGNSFVDRCCMGDDLTRDAGYGDENLSTVVVNGSVLCDSCLDGNSPIQSHPVLGASMAVSCDHNNRKTSKSEWLIGTTDEYGDFLFDLPSRFHAIPDMETRCEVKILNLPKSSPCHEGVLTGQQTGIRLSAVGNGFRAYTAPEFRLTPKYSQTCIKKQATF